MARPGSRTEAAARSAKRKPSAKTDKAASASGLVAVTVRKASLPRVVKTAAKPKAKMSGASDSTAKRLKNALAKALPGWEIVESPAALAGKMEDGFVRIDKGPSIADLKRKFLHQDVQDGADPFDADDGRETVRIRPERGGDAKTADIGPDGKVTIVQG